MPEAFQTALHCAEARSECQRGIYGKMDAQHDIVMEKLSEIEKKMAYQDGVSNGRAKESGRHSDIKLVANGSSLKEVAVKALVLWSPGIFLLLVLGVLNWLRANGYL